MNNTTSAQRYNNRMDKVFNTYQKGEAKLKQAKYDLSVKILKYLEDKGMGFCFLPSGQLITKEACEEIINDYDKN